MAVSDPLRQAMRDFGRRWVRHQRRAFFFGRAAVADEGGRLFDDSRRLLRHPRLRGPLARMLCRVATTLTRAAGGV
jgi:hypothetical protein